MAEMNYSPFEMGKKKESKVRHTLYLLFLFMAGVYLYLTGIIIANDFVSLKLTLLLVDEVTTVTITGLCYFFILIPNVDDLFKKGIISFIILSISYVTCYALGGWLLPVLKITIGIFTILNGIISLINLIRQIRDGTSFWWSLGLTIIYFGFAIDLLFFADLGTKHFFTLFGYYLLYMGLNFAKEVYYAFRKKKNHKINSISLPTIISAFLPIGFFSNLSKKVNEIESEDEKELFFTTEDNKDNDYQILF